MLILLFMSQLTWGRMKSLVFNTLCMMVVRLSMFFEQFLALEQLVCHAVQPFKVEDK